jgi:RNase P protein component
MKKMKRNYISRILRESINHILKENFNDPSYYRRKALAKVLNVNT